MYFVLLERRGEEREVSSERWERKCRGGQGVSGTTSQGSITLTEHLTSFVIHPPFLGQIYSVQIYLYLLKPRQQAGGRDKSKNI